jgi:hypothetical protein
MKNKQYNNREVVFIYNPEHLVETNNNKRQRAYKVWMFIWMKLYRESIQHCLVN